MNLSQAISFAPRAMLMVFSLDAGTPCDPSLIVVDDKTKQLMPVDLDISDDDFSSEALALPLSKYCVSAYVISVPNIQKYGTGFGATLNDAKSIFNMIGIGASAEFGPARHVVLDSQDDSGEIVTLILSHENVTLSDEEIRELIAGENKLLELLAA